MKRYIGTPPAKCDICETPIVDVFVDGATQSGTWANMCEGCHASHGVGLGTGRGQKYELRNLATNEFVKVEG